jgi:hypothetical protein
MNQCGRLPSWDLSLLFARKHFAASVHSHFLALHNLPFAGSMVPSGPLEHHPPHAISRFWLATRVELDPILSCPPPPPYHYNFPIIFHFVSENSSIYDTPKLSPADLQIPISLLPFVTRVQNQRFDHWILFSNTQQQQKHRNRYNSVTWHHHIKTRSTQGIGQSKYCVYARSLIYLTTFVCHSPPLSSRVCRRDIKWATLLEWASGQRQKIEIYQIHYWSIHRRVCANFRTLLKRINFKY